MKVLVTNQWATNKGDRAVLYFILRELIRNGIKDITVSTSNPYYWPNAGGFPTDIVKFIPWGWPIYFGKPKALNLWFKIAMRIKDVLFDTIAFPLVRRATLNGCCPWYLRFLSTKQYWEALDHTDIVIGTGGHRVTTLLIEDVRIPATFDMALALLKKKPIVFWSQTIGPLNFKSDKNRMLIQKILTEAWRMIIRDKGSVEELATMGISKEKISETRDSVLGLFDVVKKPVKPTKRKAILGISVYMIQKRTAKQQDLYSDALSRLANHAVENGYSVLFFPMQRPATDLPCIKSILRKCKYKDSCSVLEGDPETEEHIHKVAQCRLFVGHKTHSVVFALATGTPVIAIAYHQKTQDFMDQFGISQYCISDAELCGEKLLELFSMAESNLDEISQQELDCIGKEGLRVQNDFARLIEQAKNEFK